MTREVMTVEEVAGYLRVIRCRTVVAAAMPRAMEARPSRPTAAKPSQRTAIVVRWLLRNAWKCRPITAARERLPFIAVPP